jgi:hypothetical protein
MFSRKAISTIVAIVVIIVVAFVSSIGAYSLGSANPHSSDSSPGSISTAVFSTTEIATSSITITSTVTTSAAATATMTTTLTDETTLTFVATTYQPSTVSASSSPFNLTFYQACISNSYLSCSGSGYLITFKNEGQSAVSSGTIKIYFGNGTIIYGESSCEINSTIMPQYSLNCSGTSPSGLPQNGQAIVLTFDYPSGITSSYTYIPPPPSGNGKSVFSVISACASVGSHCNGGSYYVTVENVGSTTLSTGSIAQLELQDTTNSQSSTVSCTLSGPVPSGAQLTIPTGCGSTSGSIPPMGYDDSLSIKFVAPDGSTATSSTIVTA